MLLNYQSVEHIFLYLAFISIHDSQIYFICSASATATAIRATRGCTQKKTGKFSHLQQWQSSVFHNFDMIYVWCMKKFDKNFSHSIYETTTRAEFYTHKKV